MQKDSCELFKGIEFIQCQIVNLISWVTHKSNIEWSLINQSFFL